MAAKIPRNDSKFVQKRMPQLLDKIEVHQKEEISYFSIIISPLKFEGEKGIVVQMNDVTEMVKKERQLQQAQKMETIGNLAGGLAHDFNNVLGGISGTASLMKYVIKRKEFDPASFDNYIEIIEKAASRATDMVQQLLAIARKNEIKFVPVDLNLSLKHVLKICSNTFDKSVKINSKMQDDPAMANADPTQIEQVLLNICINASHAMTIMRPPDQEQGGELNCSVEPFSADKHFIRLHPTAKEIAYWAIRISDTGIGMSQETIAKIFDPFYTSKEKGVGTGLGLSMVYSILEQHNGLIDVHSQINLGSVFTIYLPQLIRYEETRTAAKPQSLTRGEGVVLVVDDEELVRSTAEGILSECGYQIITAKDGFDALEKYEQTPRIDCVLLDMAMPKMSGKQTFEKLKALDPNVKVLLNSGFYEDARIHETLKMGALGFIPKPYSMFELAQEIKRIIKGEKDKS